MNKMFLLILTFASILASCDSRDNEPSLKPENDNGGSTGINVLADEIGTGEADGYKLVWADFFNGDKLDASKWEIEVNGNGGGNEELQYYRAENISVGKEPDSKRGCLVLTAKTENFGGRSFTSGRLKTENKFEFTYGKVEARIKLPKTADGLWPAFWLLGANFSEVSWPRCGEIDILEMGNSQGIRNGVQEKFFNGACHWGYYVGGGYPNYARSSTNPYSLQDGDFHLYTLIWDSQAVRMYVDMDKNPGVAAYYEMSITDKTNDRSVGHYFHHDYFIIFNLAVGGRFTGILKPSGITALSGGDAKMYVDYVKVYQQ